MRAIAFVALAATNCATGPIRGVGLAPDVDLKHKAVLVCAWSADGRGQLLCMTPEDAALVFRGSDEQASLPH